MVKDLTEVGHGPPFPRFRAGSGEVDGREGVQVGERRISPGRPAAWTWLQGSRLHSGGPEGSGKSGVTLQCTEARRICAGG